MRAATIMTPGIWLVFGGGQRLLVPPLSLGALELLHERLTELANLQATDVRAATTIIEAAHLALKRNYPDITREQVGELVDLGNMGDVYECVMDASGMKRKAVEASQQTEGNGTAMGPSAGAASSLSSAPTQAGPGLTSGSTSTSPPSMP